MKRISDFECYYVDEEGNIFSEKSGKFLKPSKDKNGYLLVILCKNGKQFCKKVHRLVAEAFIPNPEGKPQVNHKDEDKTNNRVWVNEDGSIDYDKSNLEWCTCKENVNYGTAMKRAVQTRNQKGYYWIAKGIEKRKVNNPNNEMYKKIAETRKQNGNNRMYSLMKPIEQLHNDIVIAEYQSITDAAQAVGTSRKNISHVLLGEQKTAKGYKWRYKI